MTRRVRVRAFVLWLLQDHLGQSKDFISGQRAVKQAIKPPKLKYFSERVFWTLYSLPRTECMYNSKPGSLCNM